MSGKQYWGFQDQGIIHNHVYQFSLWFNCLSLLLIHKVNNMIREWPSSNSLFKLASQLPHWVGVWGSNSNAVIFLSV